MEKPTKWVVGQCWAINRSDPKDRYVVATVDSAGLAEFDWDDNGRPVRQAHKFRFGDPFWGFHYLGTSQTQPAPAFNCADCGYAGYGTECPACAPPQKATPEVRVGQRWKWTPGVGIDGHPQPFTIQEIRLNGSTAMCRYDDGVVVAAAPLKLIREEGTLLSEAPVPPLEVPPASGCARCGRTMQDHFSTLYDHDYTVVAEKDSGAEPRDELARLRRENGRLQCSVQELAKEVCALREPYTRKKKPEPWVPSCDIDADIPDA